MKERTGSEVASPSFFFSQETSQNLSPSPLGYPLIRLRFWGRWFRGRPPDPLAVLGAAPSAPLADQGECKRQGDRRVQGCGLNVEPLGRAFPRRKLRPKSSRSRSRALGICDRRTWSAKWTPTASAAWRRKGGMRTRRSSLRLASG